MKSTPILRRQLQKAERGFAIVSALFIVVVLAALGAFILSVSTNQHVGSALDVQGARAYEAARSGVEWGLYRVQATPAYNFSYGTPVVAVNSADPNARVCPASPTSYVPAAPVLSGFIVTVTCVATVDGNGGPTSFAVEATAYNQPFAGACPNTTNPGGNYVERRLAVSF